MLDTAGARSSRLLIKLVIVLLMDFITALFSLRVAIAQTRVEPVQPLSSTPTEQSWLSRQVQKFHSFGHLDRSYRLLASGDLNGARSELEKYLRLRPRDTATQLTYMHLSYELKDYNGTIEAATQLIAADPSIIDAYLYRALAYQFSNKLEAAVRDFQFVADAAPASAEDRTFATDMVGHLAAQSGQTSLAEQALRRLARERADSSIHIRLAALFENNDRLPEAEQSYYDALALTTEVNDKVKRLTMLSELQRRMNKLELAHGSLAQAAALIPNDAAMQQRFAESAIAVGDYHAAISALRNILRLSPTLIDTREMLANALFETRQFDDAEREYALLYKRGTGPATRQRFALAAAESAYAAGSESAALNWSTRALKEGRSLQARRLRAITLLRQHDFRAAIPDLELLLYEESTPIKRFETNLYLGQARVASQQYAAAAQAYAAAAQYRNTVPIPLAEADALNRAGQSQNAIVIYRDLLNRRDLPSSLRGHVLTQYGLLLASSGQLPAAADTLRTAIAQTKSSPSTRQALGITLYELSQWPAALDEFLAVLSAESNPLAAIYAGYCYKNMGKPGLASYYLRQAEQLHDRLSIDQRLQLSDELSYLYAEQGDPRRALDAILDSLSLHTSTDRLLLRAQFERTTGQLSDADISLTAAVKLDKNITGRAAYLRELGALRLAQNDPTRALTAFEELISIEPIPATHALLASTYRRVERINDAIIHAVHAATAEPANHNYRAILGFLYIQAKRYDDAAQILATLIQTDPNYFELKKDLAQIYARLGRSREAAMTYREAIDDTIAYPPLSTRRNPSAPLTQHLREELAVLINQFDIEFYQVLQEQQSLTVGPSGIGKLPSEGGLDIAYSHPFLGGLNPLPVRYFARVLWHTDETDQTRVRDTMQGAVGIRVKLLQRHNIWISMEKLIAIGVRARDAWMTRSLYSWEHGIRIPPDSAGDYYARVYVDGAYTSTKYGLWSYDTEGRFGYSFPLTQRISWSPHVVIKHYGWHQDLAGAEHSIAGVGSALHWRSRGTRYVAGTAWLDLTAEYRTPLQSGDPQWVAALAVGF